MSRIKLALTVVPAALLLAACSSSGSPATTPPPTTAPPATSAPAAPSPTAAATTSSASDLAGSWNGSYSGSYSGTFSLNWQQSASTLSGTIKISSLGTDSIHGTVDGSAIKFGTVGSSTVITYTGSFSGGSMSGNWTISTPGGQSQGGGTWTASKS